MKKSVVDIAQCQKTDTRRNTALSQLRAELSPALKHARHGQFSKRSVQDIIRDSQAR